MNGIKRCRFRRFLYRPSGLLFLLFHKLMPYGISFIEATKFLSKSIWKWNWHSKLIQLSFLLIAFFRWNNLRLSYNGLFNFNLNLTERHSISIIPLFNNFHIDDSTKRRTHATRHINGRFPEWGCHGNKNTCERTHRWTSPWLREQKIMNFNYWIIETVFNNWIQVSGLTLLILNGKIERLDIITFSELKQFIKRNYIYFSNVKNLQLRFSLDELYSVPNCNDRHMVKILKRFLFLICHTYI